MLPAVPHRPVRVYLPTDYQPKYAYPLLVIFHADGECEEHAARLVPLLSRRNYVALCVRGSVPLGPRGDGRPVFGWSGKADCGVKSCWLTPFRSTAFIPTVFSSLASAKRRRRVPLRGLRVRLPE